MGNDYDFAVGHRLAGGLPRHPPAIALHQQADSAVCPTDPDVQNNKNVFHYLTTTKTADLMTT